ncbi:DUF2325 domain-containing protein [Bacillus cereus]|uniref:DUF2325 domain-containing protein n=1 Tax=Bacillus cereus TaxID=1396 RepID=A0A9X6YSI3_BACCE|nr:DUF2325 domain-containing protein [Bacillus cereus]PEQ87868.1 DUF2325 domain-containing protein [Bacillus cereus]
MGMSTILVLGGSNGRTLEKLAKKRDCQVIFHDGKNHGGVKKTFRSVIKKCDVIVIQKGACGHVSIDVAKEYDDVPLLFNPGFGGTGALEMGLKHRQAA